MPTTRQAAFAVVMLVPLAALSACATAPNDTAGEDETGATSAALGRTTPIGDLTSAAKPYCIDPSDDATPDADDLAVPALDPADLTGVDGESVRFDTGRLGDGVDVLAAIDDLDPRRDAATATLRRGLVDLQIQKAPIGVRSDAKRTYLTTKSRPIADVDLVTHYVVRTRSQGTVELGVSSLRIVERATGAVLDQHSPALGFTATPGSCEEKGIVRFGPFPYGMPTLNFPDIPGCSGERCARVAEAWVRLTHNAWRARQLFAVLEAMHPVQREHFWYEPGIDAEGNDAGPRSAPAYYFGSWSSSRFDSVRAIVAKLRSITKRAKTGRIDLRLSCPDYGDNPGNVCFSAEPVAHHWVKGWVNFCSRAFGDEVLCDDGRTLDQAMHHEPLHHVWIEQSGVKFLLKDVVTHAHGGACVSGIDTSSIYCEADGNGSSNVRHFASHGNGCNHLDKLVRSPEVYATFTRGIGGMVRSGAMKNWPKPSPPTPQPPQCVGGIGCLCEDVLSGEAPDGDFSASKHCADNDGLATCVKTKFNASDTVGVCRLCDETRGPGCPCNDVTMPCDQGFCWGDDTNGNASGTGTCYHAPPPSFGCLADCERLLGNGAFCMHDHPGGARCVPTGTTLPEASNCWWDGGHMDPQTLACTFVEECSPSKTCASLGYPGYFTCDTSNRCVPTP